MRIHGKSTIAAVICYQSKQPCWAYARYFGEDEEKWGLVGLLHDFDYERYPDVAENGHPNTGAPILREHGVDEEIVQAILSHATEVTGVKRQSKMEKNALRG